MKSKTDPYRKQHVQLTHLAAAIPTSGSIESPGAVLSALVRVRALLVVHIQLESGILYPRMLRHASAPVCAQVHEHRDDMAVLLAKFVELCTRWSTAASIGADPQAFISAWKDVKALLFAHIAAEQDGLYDLADACIEERIALAS